MGTNTQAVVYRFHGFELDPGRRALTSPDGEAITLRTKVFDTLCELIARAGAPVSKQALMEAVWPDTVVEENNLNQAISALRQALGDDHNALRFIATITGRGYQFVAPVEAANVTAELPERPRRFRWTVAAVCLLVVTTALAFAIWRAPTPSASNQRLGAAEPLTKTPGTHGSPTLSPDGTLMAFVSDRTGVSQIWVKGLPDGQARQLTFGEDPAVSPSWSPVNDTILFQRASNTGRQAIWRVDALGSEPPRVVVEHAHSPNFASDGRRFVFVRGLMDLHVGEVDSGQITEIADLPKRRGFAPMTPAMNSRGDIAFSLADEGPSGNLWLYTAADGAFRQLTEGTGDLGGIWAREPAWLPDNEHIIYAAAEGDPANMHLWRINTRTGKNEQLTAGGGGYDAPVVSRDGQYLLYTQARALFGIISTDPATGEHTPIYETRASIALPVVAPDGEHVVYFGEHIVTMAMDDGVPRTLTSGPMGRVTLPTWSREGKAIYYYFDRTLHRLDPDTASSTLVIDDFHWSKQNWLAVHGNLVAYRLNSVIPGRRGARLLDLETGETRALEKPLLPGDFTRDGQALLGRRAQTYDIVVCDAPDFACEAVMDGDNTVGGAIPRWSHDETRIYFRRAKGDKPGYADIWVIDREGGPAEAVAEIGPYDGRSVYFGISADDQIIWNRYDPGGNAEIWRVAVPR